MNIKFGRQIAIRLVVAIIIPAIFSGISVTPASSSATTIRYVAATGSDEGQCDSTDSPCQTIQYAVNKSFSGDMILVAQGTYTYNSHVDYCSNHTSIKPVSVICFVDKGLTILGGYSTNDWSTANPSVNLTIIDGQNTYRGVTAVGYLTTTAYLDMEGLTIQNALAQGPNNNDSAGIGGGMLVQHAAITLRDMVFKDNQSIGEDKKSGEGGAAEGAGLRIEYAPAGTTSLLQRVTFDNNQSYGGKGGDRGGIAFGALFIAGSSATIEDCVFTNNLAQAGSSTGKGISPEDGLHADALGGGIGIEVGSILTLRHITITGNQVRGGNASQIGGGAYGAGIQVENITQFTMSDSTIVNNSAIAGDAQTGGHAGAGGIQSQDNGEVNIDRVEILSNVSMGGSSTGNGNAGSGAGGGLYIFATNSTGTYHATLTNVIVADNLAQQGNGITSTGNGGAGGIMIQGINADITHATIAGNRIGSNMVCGEALVVQPWQIDSKSFVPANVNLNYSIIADHMVGGPGAAAIMVASGGFKNGATLNLDRGLFANNSTDTIGSCIPAGEINGSSTMDSAATAGFVSPGSPNFNYHIRLDSYVKDKGIGSTTIDDINGEVRPYDSYADFGADEYWPFPLNVSASDQLLKLDWASGMDVFAGGINHFEIVVTCATDANPPDQGACGQPIDVGTATTFTLTGLSNFMPYTLIINAKDSTQNLIATSTTVSGIPTNIIIFLPLIINES